MWTNLPFAILLLTISIGMIVRHRLVAQATSKRLLDDRERDYLRRQHRRRMQASSMIGIIGLMFLGSVFVQGAVAHAIYWGLVLALVAWMTFLAIADVVSTRYYYHQVRNEYLREQAKLYGELDRIRQREGNGHTHGEPPEA